MEQNTLLTGDDLKQCKYCGNYFPIRRFTITHSKIKDGSIRKLRTNQCIYCKQIKYKEYKKFQLDLVKGLQKQIKINDCKIPEPSGICLGSKQTPYYKKEMTESDNYDKLISLTYDSLSEEEKEIYNNIKHEWRKKKECNT